MKIMNDVAYKYRILKGVELKKGLEEGVE